jgi:hypothetical protein
MIEIEKSFSFLKEMMEIPSFMSVLGKYWKGCGVLYFSINLVKEFLLLNWNKINNDDKIILIKSLLNYSIFYEKFSFLKNIHAIQMFLIVLFNICKKGIELNSEYWDKIKSIFRSSEWDVLLLNIFKFLNPFSSSPPNEQEMPSSIFFLVSLPPSEDKVKLEIINLSAKIIKNLYGENTPEEISNFLRLTDF